MEKSVVILGSTGSIGRSTIEVIESLGGRFTVVGVSANRNLEGLLKQCDALRPRAVCIGDETAHKRFIRNGKPEYLEEVFHGPEGLLQLATMRGVDIVVNALVGGIGLEPTIGSLTAGKRVALANKESLVMAGEIVLEAARRNGGEIVPVDSEHSAVFQLLQNKPRESIRKIILTASGGPFRRSTPERLAHVSVEEALNHPTWDMGKKITVDSATLANKGLEIIEAHYLFGLDYDRIQVLVHPQSIVHSMVELVDDSLLAHMSKPDMKIPIQYALTYPDRVSINTWGDGSLKLESLTFEKVRDEIFPTLQYAYQAGRRGGTAPAAYNAANEVAVERFLSREISFNSIPAIVKWALDNHPFDECPNLAKILEVDGWTRERTSLLRPDRQ